MTSDSKLLHMCVVFHRYVFLNGRSMLTFEWIASYSQANDIGRVVHRCGFFCVEKDQIDERIAYHSHSNHIYMAFGWVKFPKKDGLIDAKYSLLLWVRKKETLKIISRCIYIIVEESHGAKLDCLKRI